MATTQSRESLISDTIRELGRVPSGHLYARLIGLMDLDTYNAIISGLKRRGLVKEEFYELIWTGDDSNASARPDEGSR